MGRREARGIAAISPELCAVYCNGSQVGKRREARGHGVDEEELYTGLSKKSKNKMKPKYNLDAFTAAAELVEEGAQEFSCHALKHACGWDPDTNPAELDLFIKSFDLGTSIASPRYTFSGIARQEELGYVEDYREIRVLALLLVREIARRKNRQGTHDARAKKRAEARKNRLPKDLDSWFKDPQAYRIG
jgi:hypothetical protein